MKAAGLSILALWTLAACSEPAAQQAAGAELPEEVQASAEPVEDRYSFDLAQCRLVAQSREENAAAYDCDGFSPPLFAESRGTSFDLDAGVRNAQFQSAPFPNVIGEEMIARLLYDEELREHVLSGIVFRLEPASDDLEEAAMFMVIKPGAPDMPGCLTAQVIDTGTGAEARAIAHADLAYFFDCAADEPAFDGGG